MPRASRLQGHGLTYHVIARGIERKKIFQDENDYKIFLQKFSLLALEANSKCFAWVLMPNHFHLLFQTGNLTLSTYMQRLLTAYAVYFNNKYERSGHLFQNRYKSIVVEDDVYLTKLVIYIHTNPIRNNAKSFQYLNDFPWSGHLALLGKTSYFWQDTQFILNMFGGRQAYLNQVSYDLFLNIDLDGGGKIRSIISGRPKHNAVFNAQVLGNANFLKKQTLKKNLNSDELLNFICQRMKLPKDALISKTKTRKIVQARALFAYLGIKQGLTQAEIARKLNMTESAVSKAYKKGALLEQNF